MNTVRVGHAASVFSDGKVLVAGGHNNLHELDTAELYDPSSETCILTEDMIYSRRDAVAVKILDGKILMMGGSSNKPLDSAELYYL